MQININNDILNSDKLRNSKNKLNRILNEYSLTPYNYTTGISGKGGNEESYIFLCLKNHEINLTTKEVEIINSTIYYNMLFIFKSDPKVIRDYIDFEIQKYIKETEFDYKKELSKLLNTDFTNEYTEKLNNCIRRCLIYSKYLDTENNLQNIKMSEQTNQFKKDMLNYKDYPDILIFSIRKAIGLDRLIRKNLDKAFEDIFTIAEEGY